MRDFEISIVGIRWRMLHWQKGPSAIGLNLGISLEDVQLDGLLLVGRLGIRYQCQ